MRSISRLSRAVGRSVKPLALDSFVDGGDFFGGVFLDFSLGDDLSLISRSV